jgi:tripartite-type tricarboxylate transporter receptor subunit TctC
MKSWNAPLSRKLVIGVVFNELPAGPAVVPSILTAALVPSAGEHPENQSDKVGARGRLCGAVRCRKGPTMKFVRRQFLHLAAGAAALPVVSPIASAEVYPSRPITMIVPFAAGGGYDLVGRIMAERMRASLGQPIIIDNVSGANGSIGVGRAARAKPDGYTIDLGQLNTHVMNGAFYSLRYDLLNDFEPISPIVTSPVVLYARRTMPANDLNGLITWLKANKATVGIATSSMLVFSSFFQKEIGAEFQFVPYRGGAAAIQDLLADQIDLFWDAPLQLALVRAGRLKAYAVTIHARLATAPDIPTFDEVGLPALFYSLWYGFFAPKGTPKDISASSIPRSWTHWPTEQCNRGSPKSQWRSFPAHNKRPRRSARCRRPMPTNGGRS